MSNKRTIVGYFLKKAWTNMNIRCGKYKHLQTKSKCKNYENIKIIFSRDEFKIWCWKQKNLIESLKKPSIDRIDSKKDYTLDNIQIIELEDNIHKKKHACHWTYSNKKRGVTIKGSKYIARISIKGQGYHIGTFDTKEKAYNAFKEKYIEINNRKPW